MQVTSNMFLAVHFYLLTGISGAVCSIVCIISNLTIYFTEKKNIGSKISRAIFLLVILAISTVISICLNEGIPTISGAFPIVASAFVIFSFLSDSKTLIRAMGLIVAVCWLIYAILFKSYIAIVFEAITIMSTAVSLIKNKSAD